jgi:hypothetical protein
MEAVAPQIEQKVDELLAVLDKDIRHIRDCLSELNELRSSIVKRDDAALGRLLDKVQLAADSYAANELRRQSIRKELADILGCRFEQMTLSRLESELPKEKTSKIARRTAELRPLVKELKREHTSTMRLLSECARFNSLLLAGILDLGKTGTLVYSPKGAASQQTDNIFVNVHF